MKMLCLVGIAAMNAYVDYLLKLDAQEKSFKHLLLAWAFFSINMVVWAILLRGDAKLAIYSCIYGATCITGTLFLSYYLLQERLNFAEMFGVFLMVSGMMTVNIGGIYK